MKRLLALTLALLMCLGLLAGCGGGSKDGLESAKEYLDTIMKSTSENTPADYTVLNKIVIGKEEYTIAWAVDVTANVAVVVAEDGTITIDVNEKAEADVPYVLTATIKNAKGKTITASYNRKLPAFKELTWAEFVATADDEAVVIKGIITGIVNTDSKHELYLEDADGGYYVYNLDAEKMNGLQIGMEVRISGNRDTYYGVNQVINASVEILNATPAPVAAKDITEIVKAAQNFKAEELTKLQSTLVCIKDVTVLGQNKNDNTYYDFSIGGKSSYVRISGSANMLSDADTTTFKKNVSENVGMGATVTGIVSIYNNQIYLIPVTADAFSNFVLVERNPQEQVEFEAGLLEGLGTITDAGKITLGTDAKLYDDVTITWSLAETTIATLNGNELNIPVLPDVATEIVLTATLTNGDASTTKQFTVKISAAPTLVPTIVENPAAETLYKFFIKQYNTKQTLYFGGFDGTSIVVTTDPTKAVDVGLEAIADKPGEYYFYYMVGTAKSYIVVTINDEGKTTISNSRYSTGSNTYTYHEEFDMLCTTLDVSGTATTYWFGTYNKNEKFGVSAISYINAEKYNDSQFPAHFGSMIDVTTKTDAEKVETEKNNLSITTTFDEVGGTVSLPINGDLYAKVTITWAVDPADTTGAVVIEDGVLTAIPQKDAAAVKVIATITHGTVTQTKEFTVNVAKAPTMAPSMVTTPVAGTAYKFAITQENRGEFLYLNGEMMNTYYFGTTLNYKEAVDIYLEATETAGTFRLYGLKDGAKVYINIVASGTHINAKYETITENATPNTWTYDATLNTMITKVGEANYCLNSYGTYNSCSPSATDSATFIAHFYTMVDTSTITDDAKVDAEKNALNVNTTITEGGAINLPVAGATYEDVTITWAATDSDYVSLAGGVLNIALPADADATFTLTATITCGTVTTTKVFTVTIKQAPSIPTTVTPITDILAIKEEELNATQKYLVQGLITKIDNTKYGNLYIVDEAGNELYVYGLKDAEGNLYETFEYKPQVGDYITVVSVVSFYKGVVQLKYAVPQSVAKPNTIVEINKITEDTATEELFVVTGTITEIVNTKYGNVYIKDAEGNTLYVYGLVDINNALYETFAYKPQVGDTITVVSGVSFYKGAIQLKNAVVALIEKAPAEA